MKYIHMDTNFQYNILMVSFSPFLLNFELACISIQFPSSFSIFHQGFSSVEEFWFDGCPRYNLMVAAGPSLCGPSDGH